jgi:mono/diheme cytochrome c family protein
MRSVRSLPNEHGIAVLTLLLAAGLAGGACGRQSRVNQTPPAPEAAATPPAAAPSAADRAPAAPPAQTGAAASLQVNETEYQGWRYYHVYCARCHGQDALGSLDAADLRYSITDEGGVSPDSFLVMVRKGSDSKEMPPFHEVLEDARIQQVYAYLKARSEGRLAAGRPRRPISPP